MHYKDLLRKETRRPGVSLKSYNPEAPNVVKHVGDVITRMHGMNNNFKYESF